MKICVISNGYPDKHEPQWGCFEKDQALALKKLGHEVSVLYLDGRARLRWRKMGYSYRIVDDITTCNLFIGPLGWLDKISYKLSYWVKARLLNSAFRVLQKRWGKPDILYAHYLFGIACASHIKQLNNIKLVGIEHWSVLNSDKLSSSVLYWGNIAYRHVDCLVAVSNSLQSHIYKHFGYESIVVHDMLGPEFCLPGVKPKKGIGHFQFIAIGSLIPRKRFDLLIEAFSISKLANECCNLVIVGEGKEHQLLEKKIKELDLSKNITLVGRKTKNEIVDLLVNSDAFVLSSKAETFGVVCIEALSQGVPVIATICGGPEEFINENNGILVPPDDLDAMSEALKSMFNNYKKFNRDEISQECKNSFSPTVIANELTEIFEEVISKE